VTLFNRTASRGRALARALGARHLPWPRLRRFRCDLLINATSAGMEPETARTPIPPSWVAAPLVYDIIYNPRKTLFLRQAHEGGAEVIDGTEMFVAQAEAQFRLFTRREAPAGLMRRTLLRALRGAERKGAGSR
jgi:shikimate dehydrogenase